MNESKKLKSPPKENINRELQPQNGENKSKGLITLTGITTSQVNQALKADNPYPARVFLKVEGQKQDIPVFFRTKDPIKSKFRDFLDPNYIGTYETEISQCPFCQGRHETKYFKK